MFRQVFDPDNLFWRLISRCVDLVGLGLFWAALCLPVFTILPATAALYYTVVKVFRQGEDGGFGLMWKSFCRELKRGMILELLCLPVIFLLACGFFVMAANRGSDLGNLMYIIYYILLVVPCGVLCWIVPLVGRFDSGIRQTLSTAFLLSMRHFPTTVILVLLHLQLLVWTLNNLWPLFFTPVVAHLLASLFLEKIFPKYLSQSEIEVLENKFSD